MCVYVCARVCVCGEWMGKREGDEERERQGGTTKEKGLGLCIYNKILCIILTFIAIAQL